MQWDNVDLDKGISLSPHGDSGLKCKNDRMIGTGIMSLPARGEWIEIMILCMNIIHYISLSPHGESGLKFHLSTTSGALFWVSPRTGRVD